MTAENKAREIPAEITKIIFLDIDGVLNSQDLAYKNKEVGLSGFGGWLAEGDKATHENVLWGTELVGHLKKVVTETGAKIVISSTWRKYFTVRKFKEMFAVYQWKDAPVIDKTSFFGASRGHEIQQWLDNAKPRVSKYVIIDDATDFLQDQKSNFVCTSFEDGITLEQAQQAINILNSIP